MLPFHLEKNSQILLFPCCSRNAVSLLLCSFSDDFSFYKKKMTTSSLLKDAAPYQYKGEFEFMKPGAWCDCKKIDLNERMALALTPSPLPACMCLCPGSKNSYLKQPGIGIHARFLQWAAEMLHCSPADSVAASELHCRWPVAKPAYRLHVVCSALEKSSGVDHPFHSLDGLWEYWEPSRREILYITDIYQHFQNNRSAVWTLKSYFWYAHYDLIFKRPMAHLSQWEMPKVLWLLRTKLFI